MKWIVDRIHVCAPIRSSDLRRNEVKSTISARSARTVMERGTGELYLCTASDIQQRAALLLRDVHYVIEAHFVMTDKAAPEIIRANSRTSSSAASNGDSAITSPVSDAGNSPLTSVGVRNCRPARRN